MQLITAIDIENGQAFGPFRSHEHADDEIVAYLLELGEWTPEQVPTERVDLCQAIDEAGWLVVEQQELPTKRGPWSILAEAQERLAESWYEGELESESPEEIVAHAWRDFKYGPRDAINDSAVPRSEPDPELEQRVEAEMFGNLSEAAARYRASHDDGHAHSDADGADGRDAHAS